MWPFKQDWERNQEDVRKKLTAAEGGANMTPQGKEFWNALPAGQRTPDYAAGDTLPPGYKRNEAAEIAYWKGVAAPFDLTGQPPPVQMAEAPPPAYNPPPLAGGPMGTQAEEQQNAINRGSKIVSQAAVPMRQGYAFGTQTDYGRAPGAVAEMNARPPGAEPVQMAGISRGSMYHSLLNGANEMKFNKQDDGSVVQVTKHVRPAEGQTEGPPPGTVQTALGMPPGKAMPNFNKPPPNAYEAGMERLNQKWARFNAASNQTSMAAGLIPNAQGQISDEALSRRASNLMNSVASRQEAQRQLQARASQRQQSEAMASGERMAKSNTELALAKIAIPEQAANERAMQEMQNRRDITGLETASREKIATDENTRRGAEGQQKAAVTAGEKIKKKVDQLIDEENKNYGTFTGMRETPGDYYRNTYDKKGQLKRDEKGVAAQIRPELELKLNQLNEGWKSEGQPERYPRAGQNQVAGSAAAAAVGTGTENLPMLSPQEAAKLARGVRFRTSEGRVITKT